MMRRSGRGLAWAIAGGVVLMIGIGALLLSSLFSNRAAAGPSPVDATPFAPTAGTTAQATPSSGASDSAAAQHGWIPEPTTTDAETYIRDALVAAGTFDTQKATYEEWITYLGTWFTPDTRYASASDRETELAAAKLEMRQGVLIPEAEWNSLATESGRVRSVVTTGVSMSPVPQDSSGDMTIGTADVVITHTRSDGRGGEVEYDESARVSVQVLCGPASIPTPGTDQVAGDCKVVRFFTEPVES